MVRSSVSSHTTAMDHRSGEESDEDSSDGSTIPARTTSTRAKHLRSNHKHAAADAAADAGADVVDQPLSQPQHQSATAPSSPSVASVKVYGGKPRNRRGILIATRSAKEFPKSVSFSNVYMRQYAQIVGDNPSCSSGPPVGISWEHTDTSVTPLDRYEDLRWGQQESGTSTQSKRKPKTPAQLVLPRAKRERLLKEEWGFSQAEIAAAVRAMLKIKNARKTTINNLGKAEGMEQALETTAKALLGWSPDSTAKKLETQHKKASALLSSSSSSSKNNHQCQRPPLAAAQAPRPPPLQRRPGVMRRQGSKLRLRAEDDDDEDEQDQPTEQQTRRRGVPLEVISFMDLIARNKQPQRSGRKKGILKKCFDDDIYIPMDRLSGLSTKRVRFAANSQASNNHSQSHNHYSQHSRCGDQDLDASVHHGCTRHLKLMSKSKSKVWCMVKEFKRAKPSAHHRLWWSEDEMDTRYEEDMDTVDLLEAQMGAILKKAWMSTKKDAAHSHRGHHHQQQQSGCQVILDFPAMAACSVARGLECEVMREIGDFKDYHRESVLNKQEDICKMRKCAEWKEEDWQYIRQGSLKFSRPARLIALKFAEFDEYDCR